MVARHCAINAAAPSVSPDCALVMAAVIEALLPMNAEEREFMRGFSELPLRNCNELTVGALQATSTLRSALAAA